MRADSTTPPEKGPRQAASRKPFDTAPFTEAPGHVHPRGHPDGRGAELEAGVGVPFRPDGHCHVPRWAGLRVPRTGNHVLFGPRGTVKGCHSTRAKSQFCKEKNDFGRRSQGSGGGHAGNAGRSHLLHASQRHEEKQAVVLPLRKTSQKDRSYEIPLAGGPWGGQIHRDRK